ncbi:MAG TPA: PQQ-binding-like beta-propeller repeat protein [Bryobacteraceae bacterium]|nr:PQQ-binding-like beta-propeller repeat protein [Bryobacteraceae bacterium]
MRHCLVPTCLAPRCFVLFAPVVLSIAVAVEPFRDPSPPVAQKLPAMDAPAAKPDPNVRFHAKPKPIAANAVTHDWKSFLGPNHNGTSTETRLLRPWPASGPTLIWEMKKGTGYSSPAISGDRLVYLHRMGDQERVECLHPETGAKYWEFTYPTKFEDRYGYNNGPRASPVIDGDRVYTYGAEGKLHCLRLQTGQVHWKRDIAAEFKVPQDFFGTATTPLVHGENLIINIGAPSGPTVAAFNKVTGRMVWGAGTEWGPSYASPVPATVHGKQRIFVFAGGESQPPKGGLLSIDPANGAIDFTFPWRSRSYESVNAASPVIVRNQVFISASYRTGGALLNILPDGKHEVAWTSNEIGTHWNTAVHKDGYLYAFDGRNEPDASLVCIELKTGKVMWRANPEWEESIDVNGTQQKHHLGTFRGTLLAVDGKFLALGEMGHLLWLDLTPQGYKELARTWLFGARETWSLPVLSRGLLYISQHSRDMLKGTQPRLLCYDLRGK